MALASSEIFHWRQNCKNEYKVAIRDIAHKWDNTTIIETVCLVKKEARQGHLERKCVGNLPNEEEPEKSG